MAQLNCFRIFFIIIVVFSSLYLFLPSTTTRRKIQKPSSVRELKPSTYHASDVDTPSYNEYQRRLTTAVEAARLGLQTVLKGGPVEGIPGTAITDLKTAAKVQSGMDCITTQGSWVYNASTARQDLIRHKYEALHGVCDKQFYKHQSDDEVREAAKYTWVPSESCRTDLEMPSRADICSVLPGPILIAGDTLSYQMHDLFLDFFHDKAQTCYGENYCAKHPICPGDKWLLFRRSDYLKAQIKDDVLPGTPGHPSAHIVQKTYIGTLVTSKVAIFNRGTHYVDDEVFTAELIRDLTYVRKRAPNTLILYRGSYRGHLGCDDDWSSSTGQTTALSSPRKLAELEKLPYNWGDLHRQNLIAREIVRAIGGIYWDTEVQLEVRKDGHVGARNCLKYCIPGPIDSWIKTFYWLLKTVRDPASIK